MPAITVGLPVYNAERYLRGAIDSVLAQTYQDFELIVADNASTDSTLEIARSVAASDARVRVLTSEANRGLSWNWNRLVLLSRGRYFRWACYDDELTPTLLERCAAVLDVSPSAVGCFPSTIEIDEDGRVLGIYEDRIDARQPLPHQRLGHLVRDLRQCNALFSLLRTDVLRSTRLLGRFGHPDHVLLAELVLRGELWRLPDPLFRRRTHPGNTLKTHRSFAELARLHDPALSQRWFFPHNRLFVEHLQAIVQAPISSGEMTRCASALVSNWWLYRAMVGEVKQNAREAISARQERRLPIAG